MKKLLLFTILAFVLVSGVLMAVEKEPCKHEDKAKVKCNEAKATKACDVQKRKGHRGGYDKFKKHRKGLVDQLKKIREMAVKENATQTVNALDEMIANSKKHFDKKKAKLFKGKGCPPGCTMPCCAAKKKSGTCSKLKDSKGCPKAKDSKGCPPGCTMPCCAAKKK